VNVFIALIDSVVFTNTDSLSYVLFWFWVVIFYPLLEYTLWLKKLDTFFAVNSPNIDQFSKLRRCDEVLVSYHTHLDVCFDTTLWNIVTSDKSQSSVEVHLKLGGICKHYVVSNLMQGLLWKNFANP